jgi:hypothetical protein
MVDATTFGVIVVCVDLVERVFGLVRVLFVVCTVVVFVNWFTLLRVSAAAAIVEVVMTIVWRNRTSLNTSHEGNG